VRPFTECFGHVQYNQVKRRPDHWRIGVLAERGCEFSGCGAGIELETLVFDHCHLHGVVRGILCNGCNVRVGRIEAALLLDGVTVDLGTSAYGDWLRNCPGCAGTPPLPGRGPFALTLFHSRAAKPPLAVSGAPVSLPRLRTAHLPSGPRRTLCGRIADAMVTDTEGKALCGVCARRAGELR
jgi:hypothetical protein